MYSINATSPFVNYVPSQSATKQTKKGKIASTWDGKLSGKRYYSSLNAEIYFGGYFVDEIVQIQYSVQQQSQPLSGYNSYVFDEVAEGARIVQGQLLINFTRPNYLIDLINKINKKKEIIVQREDGEDITYQQKFESLQRNKRPMFYSEFNIEVMFGQQNTEGEAAFHVLEGVNILSSQVSLDTTGQPVGEIYSFIARDIVLMDK